MCGRFAQKKLPREYATTFRAVPSLFDWNPRYNLSPGQNALAVRKMNQESQPELILLLWGLIPHWAKEKGKYSTINARLGGFAPIESFLREIAKHKGFKRLGKNVRKELESELKKLLHEGRISIDGDVIRLL